jgi:dolichol-phosphate mannosyltransferase
MKKVYAILPCYNEQDNLENLIQKWYLQETKLSKRGYLLRIIAIDDKSTDKTKYIIQRQMKLHKEIYPIFHKENLGLGGGLLNGLTLFAKESEKGDIVIVMDSDNTHDPKYVHAMIKQIECGYDCVIASRFCNDSITAGVIFYRKFLTICAKLFYQIVLGIPKVNDYTCGFRAYSANIIKKGFMVYKQNLIIERSFACMMELLYKLHKINAKITEIPFELRYDFKKGQSKMKVMRTMYASIITAISLRISNKYSR